jgi:phage terminase large subunit
MLYKVDPVAFVREVLKIEPDEWQKDFLIKYGRSQRVAAKACKGPGKTAVLAWCAWHYLTTRIDAKVIATSISGDNLSDGLWSEMAKWQAKSQFLTEAFTWTATKISNNDSPKVWWMVARTWSRSADKEKQGVTLAGKHADNILFILDEVGGIPDAVMAAAEAALSNAGSEVNPNAEAKILICGNPTHLSGPLYRACTTEASLWEVIEITGDPDDPKRSPRISKDWARDMIKKYGRDNPWVLVTVFGKFPPSSLNALLGPDDVEAAFKRVYAKDVYAHAAKILGVDVARQGDDQTVIYPRQGLVSFKPKIMRVPNIVQIAGAVASAANKWGADAINVDGTGGFGSGVIDLLRLWGFTVNDVHFASKSISQEYYNKRSEIIFEAAKWIKNGGCLARLPEMKEEAVLMEYVFQGDKFRIIEKDQIKEKLGRSPDIFDALALTFAVPVAKRDPMEHLRSVEEKDYNPVHKFTEQNHQEKQTIDDWNPLG